ncbi:MAG: transglycosylase SLT domain-containing protein [Patescibacteria group bacterium]
MTDELKPREREDEEQLREQPRLDLAVSAEIKEDASGKILDAGENVAITATAESQDQPAGEVHNKYTKRIKEIPEETSKNDLDKIKKSSVKDIRYKTDLLTGDNSQKTDKEKALSLKDETARRIKQFTDGQDEKGWYTLNYKQHGRDADGRKHEYYDGLGDVLLDPDVTAIVVQTKSGEIIKGHRGIVPTGKHKGRLGFLDENNAYLATFTGDKFKISDQTETDLETADGLKAYTEKFTKENEDRTKNQKAFDEELKYDAEFKVRGDRFNAHTPITDEQIVKKLDERQEKDGKTILEYAKEACTKFDIPFSILKEVMVVESGWDPKAKYEGEVVSNASGLGQFLSDTWQSFLDYCEKNKIYDEKWGPKPLNQQTKFNPYANLYATAWLMNQTKSIDGFEQKTFEEQATIYYLAHHEGLGGAKKFLKSMEEGVTPKPGVLNLAKRIAYLAAKSEGREIATDWVTRDISIPNPTDKNSEGIFNGTIDVASHQKVWLAGSSTVRGFPNNSQIGRIGRDGASPKDLVAILKEHWEESGIDKLKLPARIIIAGVGFNDPDFEGYDEIIELLKSKGVSEDIVEVATLQEPKNRPEMIAFNEKLRKKYGNRCVDFVKIAENDTNGFHFNPNAYKKIAGYLLNRTT